MFSVLTMIGGKVATGLLAGVAVVVGGAGVAAYADLLPTVAQQVAHDSIGAPLPRTERSAAPTDGPTVEPTAVRTATTKPAGPDATGPAAHGLCTAFARGGLNATSTAYASLASAAKGASNIATYCATIPKPGPEATHGPDSNDSTQAPKEKAPKEKAPKLHPSTSGSAHKPAPGAHP